MPYSIGQSVRVFVGKDGAARVVTGTVVNTLPADLFEYSVLVVVPDLMNVAGERFVERIGEQYVCWYSPFELDQWRCAD